MSNAVAIIAYANVPGFPLGTVIDHVSVSVTDQNNLVTKQDVKPGDTSANFTGLADGAYQATAQAFDGHGTGLGSPATASFTITSPQTVSLSIPSALSVSQQ